MIRINSLLRRLKPWQIVSVGAATWAAILAVIIFVMCPLAEGLFSGGGMVVAILGGIAVGLAPRVFVRAYMDRKHDDAMHEALAAWYRDKEAARGGSV